jgi:hypothetical protein
MALETGTYISDLVATNPTSGDNQSQGDDHLRLIKATLQASFPNITGAMTASHSEINLLCDNAAESTFTPVLEFGGATTGITYGTQSGRYIRVGKRLFIQIRIVLTSKGSATGDATVSGLPASGIAGIQQLMQFIPTAGFSGLSTATAATLTASSTLSLRQASAIGLTNLTDSSFGNTASFNVAGFYEIA